LIKKLKSQLSVILEEEEAEQENKQATDELLRLINPTYWNLNIENSAEKEIELSFEEFMLSVREHTTEDLENITTFRFYSLLDYIKKKQNNG
jgi:ubiquitin C-terminal hydrolase